MGVVYRAHDERLKRDVALKVLAPGRLTDDDARRRFRHEALALSKLNHPNIQTVHDFDSANGLDFLVTEFVEGATLDARLLAGPLPEKEVLRLGCQLAEGLGAAHARGIVHRDLKPPNIKITPDGRLKILDFGIARSTPTEANTQGSTMTAMTAEPRIIGTPPYMAPEQLRGEAVDARTDLFAAGAVLYELSTAKRAFTDTITARLVDSILNQPPPAPRSVNPQISAELERIILKCLEKEPENRYQSAAELAVDLRRLETGRVTAVVPARSPSRQRVAAAISVAVVVMVLAIVVSRQLWTAPAHIESIAVLPMQNLSADPSQEYFADGMTDALITDLGHVGGLKRVIARGSIMRYKKTTKALPEIARELHVDALVSGAVVRDGNRVRVTAELIDPKTQEQLWSDSYERDLRNILSLQHELATTIAAKIRVKLTPDEGKHLSGAREVNREAFDAYLRARAYKYKPTPKDLDLRLRYAQLAVEKDPDFAEAHAFIAGSWVARVVYGFSSGMEALPKARTEALRALELDPASSEAHQALAIVKYYLEWDWSGAEREFRKAIELEPGSPDAHFQYATFLGATMHRAQEWKQEMDRCIELDPLNVSYRFFRARQLMTLGKPEESIAALNEVLKQDPDFPLIHQGLWYAYESTRQYDRALAEAEKAFAVKNDAEVVDAIRRGRVEGGYPAATRRAAAVLERRAAQTFVSPALIARLYTVAGDREKAVNWLERGYQERDQAMISLANSPVWDPLRSEPRFQDLIRRLHFPAGE